CQPGNDDIRGDRQEGGDRERCERPIIRPIWHASRGISQEAPCDSPYAACRRPGAVTRCYPPCVLPIVPQGFRITNRVLLVHVGRATAVFEIINGLSAHERILNAAEVNPQVGELVHEKRGAVEKFVAVHLFPAIGRRPRPITLLRQAVRRRTEAEHVQNQRLVVSLPAMSQKAGLWLPPM